MQAAANAFQDKMGPVPTVVHPEYKHREDGSTMKALAWFGAQDVRLIDAPVPEITEPDDVILQGENFLAFSSTLLFTVDCFI
jgi:hypothetical protein